MSNSENPRNGAIFQQQVMECLRKKYHKNFELEKKLLLEALQKNTNSILLMKNKTLLLNVKDIHGQKQEMFPVQRWDFVMKRRFISLSCLKPMRNILLCYIRFMRKGTKHWQSIITELIGTCSAR